jgi:hypothetical protein
MVNPEKLLENRGCQSFLPAKEGLQTFLEKMQAPGNITFNDAVVTLTQKIGPDSYLVKNFVHLFMKLASLFGIINDSAPWIDPANPDMRYRGNELKRQKAFMVTTADATFGDTCPSWIPKYSYPGFQYAAMLLYRDARFVPIVNQLFAALNDHLRIPGLAFTMNHCIATRYRDEADNIGFHSDKTRDITPTTPILSLSFCDAREFHLKRISDGATQHLVLRDGDLFILGPETNRLYQHAVVPVAQERVLVRTAPAGPRISLAFRDIATMCSRGQILTKTAANRRARAKRAAEELAVAPTVGKKAKRTFTIKKRLLQKIVSKK